MQTLQDQRIVVAGGSRGLGLGIVEALVARKANVTVVARDSARLGVGIAVGDVTDPAIAERVIGEVRRTVLVLNAGAAPATGPIHTLTWETFSQPWNTDVQAGLGLRWIQAAIRLPLPRQPRYPRSSGAAIGGSPLSGGYRRDAHAVAHGRLRQRQLRRARARHPSRSTSAVSAYCGSQQRAPFSGGRSLASTWSSAITSSGVRPRRPKTGAQALS